MAQHSLIRMARPYSCPDCPRGGERWETARELGVHLCEDHPAWSLGEIEAEINEQRGTFRAAGMVAE